MSKRLKEQYPEEMTIVLQYQFWDLQVSNDRFEVKLSFGSLPERLVVPFQAVKAFYDPLPNSACNSASLAPPTILPASIWLRPCPT